MLAMIVTNRYDLPSPLFRALQGNPKKPKERYITVTELISPAMIRKLTIQHWDELKIDASEKLWALLGTAIHEVISKHAPSEGLAEESLKVEFKGWTISGRPDLWIDGTLIDWKVTSVWSFLMGEKPEWEAQLNVYHWLYHQHGFESRRLQIFAILRDWKTRDAKRVEGYPEIPFLSTEVPLWSLREAERYIKERLKAHENPKPCTEEEKWGGKRCKYYCPVREFCQYKED